MVKVEWEDERVLATPLSLYVEYLNLRHGFYIKDKLSDADITEGEFTYLANIFYAEAMSQRELADLLFVSQANVAKMLKKLEAKNLIERVVDENNKSRKLIYLTEKGKAITLSLLNFTFSWESKILDSYSNEEIKKFKEMLFELVQKSVDVG